MSMSSHVMGFKAPTPKFNAMLDAYRSCVAAKIQIPEEVLEFFGHEEPDEAGIEVSLKGCIRPYAAEMCDGFEVDLSKLPEGVTMIRFYNSY